MAIGCKKATAKIEIAFERQGAGSLRETIARSGDGMGRGREEPLAYVWTILLQVQRLDVRVPIKPVYLSF